MDEAAIVALARRQHGLITTKQLAKLGATSQQVWHRVSKGSWARVRRGVIAVGASPTTWERDVMAACLAGGAEVTASHRTAARLWGLVQRSGRIEVLAAEGRPIELDRVTTHRSYLFPPSDRSHVAGIPVTTPARTIIDLAPGHPSDVVGVWIDDTLRRRISTLADISRCVRRLAVPGRPRIDGLHGALSERLPGYDPGDSELEAFVFHALSRAGLPLPSQQIRVVRPDGTPAFVDLGYPDHRIAIEADGWDTHGTRRAFDNDRLRANDLTVMGWRVLRFTSKTTEATIVRTIRGALGLDAVA